MEYTINDCFTGAVHGIMRHRDDCLRKRMPGYLAFLTFLLIVSAWFSSRLYLDSAAEMFSEQTVETDSFRRMSLTEEALSELLEIVTADGMTPGTVLTALYPFYPDGYRSLSSAVDASGLGLLRKSFLDRNRDGYQSVSDALTAIWDDIRCFPAEGGSFYFENTWMYERSYGGIRGHEGTDIIPPDNLAGIYPVVSMTDGIVEKIGWLEKGGYRIGIRGVNGGYFYYAHLDSYARDFEVGDEVYAGEQLGMMGDSGYGEEGTRGQFDVHLHIGIYIRTKNVEELSINPYWVLRYSQGLQGG
ncbi:MAG: M23 family metallopeptidase [Lachnospiraceae bacterium]|nr:M23 family metallopeptidase [Lachnospiraceae bacterium]